MDHLAALVALFVVDLVAAVSPGPNFVLVSATSLRLGRRHGVSTVLGILAANALWVVAALLGLSLLFEAVPWLYGILKTIGGAYLLYLAIQYWRAPTRGGDANVAPLERRGTSSFRRGALTGISNPKSLVYFGSVFTLFVAPGSPMWVQLLAGAIVLFNGALWYGAVALLFGAPRVQRVYLAVERPLNRVTGLLMGAFGARLLWQRD